MDTTYYKFDQFEVSMFLMDNKKITSDGEDVIFDRCMALQKKYPNFEILVHETKNESLIISVKDNDDCVDFEEHFFNIINEPATVDLDLIVKVLERIEQDVYCNDLTAVEELIKRIPKPYLTSFLSEE